jgi:hypothetical protein
MAPSTGLQMIGAECSFRTLHCAQSLRERDIRVQMIEATASLLSMKPGRSHNKSGIYIYKNEQGYIDSAAGRKTYRNRGAHQSAHWFYHRSNKGKYNTHTTRGSDILQVTSSDESSGLT